ncbi:glycosyltransferase family 2 protein [Jiella sonneratiae]|uniref:Glycosyltransferase family 2 protein n=1 Tax=Jiella sonneratiae TaxID=2816856 RepID=A0ABS3JA43_9HYPH|nr:glycosyltransferase [Jiella sonneratiae]MBO0906552.1 glycosyltransferase family 2 protein [Jiella sonneratiae]
MLQRKAFSFDDVEILVPVFNAADDVVICADTLKKTVPPAVCVTFLDDASRKETQRALSRIATLAENFRVMRRPSNVGYTSNVYYGIQDSERRLVVVANSDCVFVEEWLGPLLSAFNAYQNLVGAGPVSNAASYQSVPFVFEEGVWCENFEFFEGVRENRLERLNTARLILSQVCSFVPILNGFCTMLDREAVISVGNFDIHNFPIGYGEENDLCLRLLEFGGDLAVVPSSIVLHSKSKSFGHANRSDLSEAGRKVLNRRYGDRILRQLTKTLHDSTELDVVRRVYEKCLRRPLIEGEKYSVVQTGDDDIVHLSILGERPDGHKAQKYSWDIIKELVEQVDIVIIDQNVDSGKAVISEIMIHRNNVENRLARVDHLYLDEIMSFLEVVGAHKQICLVLPGNIKEGHIDEVLPVEITRRSLAYITLEDLEEMSETSA